MVRFRQIALILAIGCPLLFCAQAVYAQSVGTGPGTPSADAVILAERLETLQSLIEANALAREDLRVSIGVATPTTLPELQLEFDRLVEDDKKLRDSFEQVAIGSIDTSVLEAVDTSFDWRGEVTQILQPIVENLKSLTDKPRKISQLQSLIEQNSQQSQVIDDALVSIDAQLKVVSDVDTQQALTLLLKSWRRDRDDNQQNLSVARTQLAELQNYDVTWSETLRESSTAFFKGRGLTLLLALVVATIIWLLLRGLLWLFQRGTRFNDKQELRTRRRLAQYAYNALVVLLILMAVMSVFYIRGDLLLMGLSILAAAGVALGLRHGVPRFISETRLLLNIGSIREQERVMYNGLPWKVVSLNLNSILKNPDLTGVVRLPLSELKGMISRPAGEELWFPSSQGDLILLDDERLLEVISQTPEMIELKDRGGTLTTVPTADFYAWSFKNLSRSETFGISSAFGVDYQLQSISLTTVPRRFREAVIQALSVTEFGPHTVRVSVELCYAGSSSLDYWLYVTLKGEAAKGYLKIQRLIQRTCIEVCTREGWGIPYPHVTIQRFDAGSVGEGTQ